MIIALAGRRIDALDAKEERFPLKMKKIVYERIREFFHNNKATVLVSSAACGADLLAQKAARDLEIDQHIILPFEREKFRTTSVIDRPGNWGDLFDRICDEVEREENLIVLENSGNDEEKAYSAVTTEILNQAESLKENHENEEILVVVVWEGKAKDEKDETAAFAEKAGLRNLRLEQILTI